MKKQKSQKKVYNCRRIRFRNKGHSTYVYYTKPVNKNDAKRYGRYLEVEFNGVKVKFDGRQINTIKKALRHVGEIGGRVDRKKCDIW